MAYSAGKPRRRSIRLPEYDYCQPGAYFVTICTEDRECLLGELVAGEMRLGDAGDIALAAWNDLPMHYAHVRLDTFVVMPNHVHGIIILTETFPADATEGAGFKPAPMRAGLKPAPTEPAPMRAGFKPAPTDPAPTDPVPMRAGFKPAPTEPAPTDPVPIRAGFKPAPTEPAPTEAGSTQSAKDVQRHGLPEIVRAFKTFSARRINELRGTPGIPVWQRNYYEHIIRNAASLERIRAYIEANPERWTLDRENPQRSGLDELEGWIYSSSTGKKARS